MANSDKLNKLKLLVKQYEKELLVKQEEIKNISRNMLSKKHTVDDVKKFLNSGLNEELFSIYEELLNAYRHYVEELESVNDKK
jgi:predicted  nucleic acid-binding Zn-ribbon protein